MVGALYRSGSAFTTENAEIALDRERAKRAEWLGIEVCPEAT
jgi:hypothetical protein